MIKKDNKNSNLLNCMEKISAPFDGELLLNKQVECIKTEINNYQNIDYREKLNSLQRGVEQKDSVLYCLNTYWNKFQLSNEAFKKYLKNEHALKSFTYLNKINAQIASHVCLAMWLEQSPHINKDSYVDETCALVTEYTDMWQGHFVKYSALYDAQLDLEFKETNVGQSMQEIHILAQDADKNKNVILQEALNATTQGLFVWRACINQFAHTKNPRVNN